MIPKNYPCADGFCGAEDCPRCRPWNFQDGVYLDPDLESELEAESNLAREIEAENAALLEEYKREESNERMRGIYPPI